MDPVIISLPERQGLLKAYHLTHKLYHWKHMPEWASNALNRARNRYLDLLERPVELNWCCFEAIGICVGNPKAIRKLGVS